MNLEILRVSDAELEEWRTVVSWVYAKKAPEPDSYPIDPGEQRFLARVNGFAAGACAVYDYQVARGDVTLKTGGVAAVATLPQHRRSGVADALMRAVVNEMNVEGVAMSALYPYKESYYRKFGYETCGWRYQIKCPQARLPKLDTTLPIEQISSDDLSRLEGVHHSFIRSRSGSPYRTAVDWSHRMGKKPPMVYVIGGVRPEAYLWVHLEDFWGDVNVGEIAWTTRDGYEACLSLLRSLASNQSTITWNEPPDSPFVTRYLDQGATVSINRATMFRIIDLKNAIQPLRAHSRSTFSVKVCDSECAANNGVWRVSSDSTGSTVEPCVDWDFEITVGHLSQALMGQPSLSELRKHGFVTVKDENGFQAALALFSPFPVVCMEFF